MDINTKTQLTNIFAKGMNSDISDAMIENNQYRLANNMRYVTDDQENSGEMHVIEGAKNVCNVPGTVRGMESIRLWGVIVTEYSDGSWDVYRFDLPETLVPISHITDHPLGKNKLSLVTKYEDEKNVKVYIADGENPVCVVNIKPTEDHPELITDYNKITSYPNVVLAPPTFKELINGTLKAGIVQYSYQYYNTWGTATDASIPTRLIPLHNKVPSLDNLTNFKGFEQGKESNKGVSIEIKTNPSFDKIRVFRISYVEAGQPPLIELILDTDVDIESIKAGTYTVDDTGMQALQIYSVEEYNGIAGIHIIPKVIESKDDYMFAAAVKTSQTELDKRLSQYDFECRQIEKSGVDIYDMSKPLNTVDNNYRGQYISWEFITQELVGDENGTKQELIKLSEDGYANPQNVYKYTSLRRDELYRFGIILYDNKGNHSSVFWIADVRTPSINAPGFQTFSIDPSTKELKTYALGIRFYVNLSQIPDIVGYEIVRCNRSEKDIATVAQGVLSRPGRRYSLLDEEYIDRFPLTPTGWLTTADVIVPQFPYAVGKRGEHYEEYRFLYSNCNILYKEGKESEERVKRNQDVFQFVCPEYCYQSESFKLLTEKDGMYLKPQLYLYSKRFDDVNVASYNNSEDKNHIKLDTTKSGLIFQSNEAHLFPYYHKENTGILEVQQGVFGRIVLSSIYPGNKYTHVPVRWNNDVDSTTGSEPQNIISNAAIYYPTFTHTWVYYAKQKFEYTEKWDDLDIKDRHQYLKLYNKTDDVEPGTFEHAYNKYDEMVHLKLQDISNIPIISTACVDALGWDDLADANNQSLSGESYPLKYVNHLKNIGDDSFVNWVCTNFYNMPIVSSDGTGWYMANEKGTDRFGDIYGGIQGPGGKTMLLKLETDGYNDVTKYLNATVIDRKATGDSIQDSMFGTYLCNVRQNVTPYGGYSDEAKKLSNYYSYSYYNDVRESSLSVFGGDCFIQPFEYVSMHKFYHNRVKYPRNSCVVYAIPVETNINLAYTYGFEFSKNFTSGGAAPNLQDQPSDVFGFFNQDTPLYAYNGAYSSSDKLKLFAAYLDDDTNIDNEDYRCYYSNPKSNNESIDNWTIYQPANFLDVDTRRGPITGLRRFHNNLVFWQRDATGLFSVNERTTITDDSNMPLLLGTGGVLSRYDYINTSNGMRENEFADTQSDSTLYWWDHNKADICAYAGGQEMVVLSKIKNVSNFLNKNEKEGRLINEPALAFDKKYNEMIASVTNGEGHDAGSLVYSEQTQQFIGLYDINHIYKLMFADSLYLYQNTDGLYKWDECAKENEAFGITKDHPLLPYIKYIVNDNQQLNKVFDNVMFGARVYGGGYMEDNNRNKAALNHLTFEFKTPLKQSSKTAKEDWIDNVEYDFRFAVPRNNNDLYGGRMRGKTMQCELSSDTNSLDLSIQYITTKYRISWS